MAIRMRNERTPELTLNLAHTAWLGIVDLALLYGWNPMGAALPGSVHDEVRMESYFPGVSWAKSAGNGHPRLVLLEDALNLADALEQAFREYEPVRMPASFFLFEPDDELLRLKPSIGALTAVIDFCRTGPFYLESHQLPWYYAGD